MTISTIEQRAAARAISLDATPITLAANITIGAGQAGPVISGIARGVYTLDLQFTGVSIKLQALGADGTSWRNVLTVAANGTYPGDIRIGANASIRLFNPNAAQVSGVYGVLS